MSCVDSSSYLVEQTFIQLNILLMNKTQSEHSWKLNILMFLLEDLL